MNGLWSWDFGLCASSKIESLTPKTNSRHPSSFLLYPFFRAWCNASIRVLETRGDSSILSSRTKDSGDFRFPIANWARLPGRNSAIGNQKSAMTSGDDVAGNMRDFQPRFESSNLSLRSNLKFKM